MDNLEFFVNLLKTMYFRYGGNSRQKYNHIIVTNKPEAICNKGLWRHPFTYHNMKADWTFFQENEFPVNLIL